MRLFSIPPPTLLAGFLAVLIGYASSAAIIWQAAIVAGAWRGFVGHRIAGTNT